jgi:hypothetical protein
MEEEKIIINTLDQWDSSSSSSYYGDDESSWDIYETCCGKEMFLHEETCLVICHNCGRSFQVHVLKHDNEYMLDVLSQKKKNKKSEHRKQLVEAIDCSLENKKKLNKLLENFLRRYDQKQRIPYICLLNYYTNELGIPYQKRKHITDKFLEKYEKYL